MPEWSYTETMLSEITSVNTKNVILNPNRYIEFYMDVEIVQSNMYLFSMYNSAELIKASNINNTSR